MEDEPADEISRTLTQAVTVAPGDSPARSDREFVKLRAAFEQLFTIFEGKGLLHAGHRRLIDKVAERAGRAAGPKVRLRLFVDKYQVPNADIDCAARLPLCHGRCCAFSFELSAQDLEEGVVRWELEEPYMIRHADDGYCAHVDQTGPGCAIYAQRPSVCRAYDCREDARVWLDFQARIPAPMPDGLHPRPRASEAT